VQLQENTFFVWVWFDANGDMSFTTCFTVNVVDGGGDCSISGQSYDYALGSMATLAGTTTTDDTNYSEWANSTTPAVAVGSGTSGSAASPSAAASIGKNRISSSSSSSSSSSGICSMTCLIGGMSTSCTGSQCPPCRSQGADGSVGCYDVQDDGTCPFGGQQCT